jgi:hypothetical protein
MSSLHRRTALFQLAALAGLASLHAGCAARRRRCWTCSSSTVTAARC